MLYSHHEREIDNFVFCALRGGEMKRIAEIISSISAFAYLLVFVLGKFYSISPAAWQISLGIMLVCQGYLGFCRYRETRNKIEMLIPVLTGFFMAATVIIYIYR